MGVLGFKVDSRERVDEIYADPTGAGYAGQQEPYDEAPMSSGRGKNLQTMDDLVELSTIEVSKCQTSRSSSKAIRSPQHEVIPPSPPRRIWEPLRDEGWAVTLGVAGFLVDRHGAQQGAVTRLALWGG
jgi:hypothetical protein